MRRALALALSIVIAMTLACGAAPAAPPGSAPPGIEILEDGAIIHRPSGLRLPRDIHGPKHVYTALLKSIGPDGVILDYGPITVTIAAPAVAADPVMQPQGWRADPDAPALPALLFWGDTARPETVSFLHTEGAEAKDWVSFTVIAQGWQIEFSSLYPPEARDTVLRTAEAVWAMLASANEDPPR